MGFLPKDLEHLVVSYVACAGPEILEDQLDRPSVFQWFDVRNAETLEKTVNGLNLSLKMYRNSCCMNLT